MTGIRIVLTLRSDTKIGLAYLARQPLSGTLLASASSRNLGNLFISKRTLRVLLDGEFFLSNTFASKAEIYGSNPPLLLAMTG